MTKKPAPLNIIWLLLIVVSTVIAAYTGAMADLTKTIFDSAKAAVTLAIGLIGAMALWLGLMKVVEEAGLMTAVARAIRPVMRRLFPDVPADHPAMSAMIMNMAANMLGLGNAATPMGVKAMAELDKLNAEKGTATDAMCLFLAINTSSVTLLPLGAITIRAAAGAVKPAAILVPSLIATICSTTVAIVAARAFARRQKNAAATPTDPVQKSSIPYQLHDGDDQNKNQERCFPGPAGRLTIFLCIAAFAVAVILKFTRGAHPPLFSIDFITSASNWLVPLILCVFLLIGYFRGVKVYETVTDGAREGFNVAIRIIPFMVAIFVAIGMFRASGALRILGIVLKPVLEPLGMPAEALPMALLRPLSGSGAFGYMSEVVSNSPDNFVSFLVSTMQGSTETTFYVLAVYFGSIGIRKTRHALPAALCADAAGIAAALIICRLMY